MIVRVLLLAVLIGATVAISGWLRGLQEELERVARPAHPTTPDYTFSGVELTRFGVSGEPAWRIESPSMAHFAAHDRARLASPRAWLYRPEGPPFRLRAERAWILADGEKIELQGAVDIRRPAYSARPALQVDTREVVVRPAPGTARTDKKVLASYGDQRLRGLGMRLDAKADTLDIPARARGTYAP